MRGRRNCWRWCVHVGWRYVSRTLGSPCQTFREWLTPLWWSGFLSEPMVAHCRQELWSGVRLLARLGAPKGMWLSVLNSICSSILDETRWHSIPNKVPRVTLSTIELEQTCPKLQTKTVASSVVWVVPFCSHNNRWILWLFESFPVLLESNLFYSSYEVKLPSPQWVLSLEVVTESEDTLLAELCLKNLGWLSEYEPGIVYTFLCTIHAEFLAQSSMRKVHSIDLSSNVGAFGFRWFRDPVRMNPSVSPNFPFSEHAFSRDDGVSLAIGSCHPTEFSRNCTYRSWFDGMWIATEAEILFSWEDSAVCLYAHLSLHLHPPVNLNFVRSGSCKKMHEFPFWHLPFLKITQSSLFAFSDGLLPLSSGGRTWPRSTLPIAFLVRVVLECACIST